MAETAQKNKAPVVVQPVALPIVQRGAGLTGTTAIVTTTLVKATATTPAVVNPATTHNGGFVASAATAGNFDRTVATSLGK